MFGLGFSEFLILGLIAFLIFGPKQFPLIAREFIKLLNELRQGFSNIKTEFQNMEAEVQEQIHQTTKPIKEEIRNLGKSLEKKPDGEELEVFDQIEKTLEDSEILNLEKPVKDNKK